MRLATPYGVVVPMLPEVRRRGRRARGLGDQASAQAAVGYSSAGASSAVGLAVAAHLIPANLVPFIGPAIAGVALLAAYLIKNSGCGQTCIQTSQWANQAQEALKQNIDAYFALPAPRSKANQDLALQTFDQIWAKLAAMCGDPQWGDAGKRCISDRQAGACTWKATENSQWPGGVQLGQCFNWFAGFRDPIANDTAVDNGSPLSSAGSVLASAGAGLPGWVIPAAVVALLVAAL